MLTGGRAGSRIGQLLAGFLFGEHGVEGGLQVGAERRDGILPAEERDGISSRRR
jgi:hypothetical protein